MVVRKRERARLSGLGVQPGLEKTARRGTNEEGPPPLEGGGLFLCLPFPEEGQPVSDGYETQVNAKIIDDPRVRVTVSAEAQNPSPVSDPEGAAFELVARTIRETNGEDVIVAPYLVVGGTDAKYYSDASDAVFRFLPARFEEDAMTRFHGTDERMGIEGYLASIRFFHQLILNSDSMGG